jgi:hypothetical protein
MPRVEQVLVEGGDDVVLRSDTHKLTGLEIELGCGSPADHFTFEEAPAHPITEPEPPGKDLLACILHAVECTDSECARNVDLEDWKTPGPSGGPTQLVGESESTRRSHCSFQYSEHAVWHPLWAEPSHGESVRCTAFVMRRIPVPLIVSHSLCATLCTVSRWPQNASISGMNGRFSSSPRSSGGKDLLSTAHLDKIADLESQH